MKELPQAPDGGVPGPEEEAGAPPQVSAGRLVSTLALAGGLAGLVIVLVFEWAQPRIQAHRAEVLREAVQEVLGGPDSYRALYVTGESLSEAPPPGVDTVTAEKVYLGVDAAGTPLGFAITGREPGYQDFVEVIFGYEPGRDRVLGMKVLESKETPGLGDRIVKDSSFVAEFSGVEAPIEGVKPDRATGRPQEVDLITGATISSRTVISIINHRIEELDPLLDAWLRGNAP